MLEAFCLQLSVRTLVGLCVTVIEDCEHDTVDTLQTSCKFGAFEDKDELIRF